MVKVTRNVSLALVAMAIGILALWLTNRAVTPKEATWEDAAREAKAGGYRLFTVEALRTPYEEGSTDLLLVDTRQEWEYRTGHIKGAVNFPMEPIWLSRWRKRSSLAKLLGPDKDRLVVFY